MNIIEYVWIDGVNELRSKIKVYNNCKIKKISDIPEWNYDGSSTYQASGEDSEIIIKPCALFKNPLIEIPNKKSFLVMCDTYKSDGITPLLNNNRYTANNFFNQDLSQKPWFGLEQEYFLIDNKTNKPLGFPMDGMPKEQGQYYCSVGQGNSFGRVIAEEHMKACILAGIKISGINAEVAPGQWEFQIGPCLGIEEGDHLWMARYLLYKIAEKHNVGVSIHPKFMSGDWNGSGCHANYSTRRMRSGTKDKNGLEYIKEAIEKLKIRHKEHMDVYGTDNNMRMTGKYETSSFEEFTHGVANRGASIRIGNENYKNEKGYFEDRRPSSNCDPYLVTGIIFQTTCLLDNV